MTFSATQFYGKHMNSYTYSFWSGVKWVVAIAIGVLAGMPKVMKWLAILMFIDFVTACIFAWKEKHLSSEIGGDGLVNKGLILALLCSAQVFENALGTDLNLQHIGAMAYCINEFISIIENVAKCGAPIPPKLVEVLLNVKNFRASKATPAQIRELRTDTALADEREGSREALETATKP
jgi:toxin secretion/phage lysis holin